MYDGQFTSDGDWLYPSLWDGCIFAALPAFGASGLSVYDWTNNTIGTINGATAANAWTQSNGLWAYKSNATSDYADFGSNIANQMNTKQAALSAWIYKPSSSVNASAGFGQNLNHQFLINLVAGVAYFQADSGTTLCYPNVTDNRTGWNHYAMSYNGNSSTVTAWINGVQQTLSAGGVAVAAQISVTGVFTIGRQQSATRFNTSGVLTDDVMLFNRQMTNDEVQSRYAGGYGRGIAYTPIDTTVFKGSIVNRLLSLRRKAVAA